MITGMLHTHKLVVILFLLLYITKTILLLTNRNEWLEKVKAKTKIADMVLGTLLLITGVFLLLNIPEIKAYHMVKLIITLISVPMGIIAFRRKNKIIATSLLVVFVYIYGVAETKSFRFKKEKITIKYEVSPKVGDSNSTADNILQANENNISVKGKIIYEKICASCHGIDGKLGMSGAKDLTLSTLSLQEKISVINRGKNLMNGYKDVLTEDEIEAVALYVHGMKK